MAEKEFFIDDRVIIPEHIQKMSREELNREIVRLESEARKEKERILKSVKKI